MKHSNYNKSGNSNNTNKPYKQYKQDYNKTYNKIDQRKNYSNTGQTQTKKIEHKNGYQQQQHKNYKDKQENKNIQIQQLEIEIINLTDNTKITESNSSTNLTMIKQKNQNLREQYRKVTNEIFKKIC